MTHPLVTQLRFTRNNWLEGLEGVTAEEAVQRMGQMNCISWLVGHVANFEQFTWIEVAQGKSVISEAVRACGFGKPASTPPLADMQAAWQQIMDASDEYLDMLTHNDLETVLTWQGKPYHENIGTMILRHTYHYWYHLGEMQAIRQMLGHSNLPRFVGSIPPEFHYTPPT